MKETFKSFTANEPNVLTFVDETSYEDFDTALSAFYVASSARPGFDHGISKNNPRKAVSTSINYNTSTTIFSYTYSDQNATITSKPTWEGTSVTNTEITYDQCNEAK